MAYQGAEEQETYNWGPTNHPYTAAATYDVGAPDATTATESLHWDGGQLLFTSSASGVDQIFLGRDAVFDTHAGTFGVTPRDASGTQLGCGDLLANAYQGCASAGYPFQTETKQGYILINMPRADGINTMLDTIQGVRSHNSDSQSWTTPDAYPGSVNDPMTLQKYMWNGNNPIAYSDPSGYTPSQREGIGDGSMGGLMMNPGMYGDGGDYELVAQWVSFAEAVLEAVADAFASESEATISEGAVEEAWEGGDHEGVDDPYQKHGVGMNLSRTAYLMAPAKALIGAMKSMVKFPAVLSGHRLYVYNVAAKAMAIFHMTSEGELVIDTYYPAAISHFWEQGMELLPEQVKEWVGGASL